jgi:hypothetical protein
MPFLPLNLKLEKAYPASVPITSASNVLTVAVIRELRKYDPKGIFSPNANRSGFTPNPNNARYESTLIFFDIQTGGRVLISIFGRSEVKISHKTGIKNIANTMKVTILDGICLPLFNFSFLILA